jgi:hypothetical protein
MGLNMYLYKKHYVKNWDHYHNDERFDIKVKKGGKNYKKITTSNIKYIIEEVADWRKFNALHNWFVVNCQDGKDDCKEYFVSQDKLDELLQILLRIDNNHDLAEELLPSTDGFFFGGVDYDEYYFDCIKDTIEVLQKLLFDWDDEAYIIYRSSW